MRNWNGYYRNHYEIWIKDIKGRTIAVCRNGTEAREALGKKADSPQGWVNYHFNRPNSLVKGNDGKSYRLTFVEIKKESKQ